RGRFRSFALGEHKHCAATPAAAVGDDVDLDPLVDEALAEFLVALTGDHEVAAECRRRHAFDVAGHRLAVDCATQVEDALRIAPLVTRLYLLHGREDDR